MKYVFFLIAITLLACGAKKNEEVKSEVETIQKGPDMAEGIIRVTSLSDECGVFIESNQAGDSKGFYPVNLDVKFKKNGLPVKFTYAMSRAPLPDACIGFTAIVVNDMIAQ